MRAFLAIMMGIVGDGVAGDLPEGIDFQIHRISSEYQNGEQEIRVILPESYHSDDSKKYRVLYILPVERKFEDRYGYGLATFAKLDAHNRFDLILVQPGFEQVPWFGDHATDPAIRQESHLKKAVVPLIDEYYHTVGTSEGRLLIGFSKSGWGAFSLILRDPDFWGLAAGWDSPMMLERAALSMGAIFGTQQQLDQYRPDLLARSPEQMDPFRKQTRLVLTGEKSWGVNPSHPAPGGGSHTIEYHRLLEDQRIRHHYDNSLEVPHRWDSGWAGPTLETLMNLAGASETRDEM